MDGEDRSSADAGNDLPVTVCSRLDVYDPTATGFPLCPPHGKVQRAARIVSSPPDKNLSEKHTLKILLAGVSCERYALPDTGALSAGSLL